MRSRRSLHSLRVSSRFSAFASSPANSTLRRKVAAHQVADGASRRRRRLPDALSRRDQWMSPERPFKIEILRGFGGLGDRDASSTCRPAFTDALHETSRPAVAVAMSLRLSVPRSAGRRVATNSLAYTKRQDMRPRVGIEAKGCVPSLETAPALSGRFTPRAQLAKSGKGVTRG